MVFQRRRNKNVLMLFLFVGMPMANMLIDDDIYRRDIAVPASAGFIAHRRA